MAIKDPLMFITIEEFKNWKGFNKSLFDEVTTPDSEIRYAIEIASSNIDFLSGFTISKKWSGINPTKFTDNIQTATTHYVNFLLGKGVEYARGQASIGQGGITYSQNNSEDPYYIVPQVFNYLKEINEYLIMQGFNLDVSSKQNWFKKFMGNDGEQNPWEIYVQFTNIKSSDDRTKIKITHPKNIMGSVLDIDTRGIKSFDNLTTLELFTKYFSNDSLQLVDGKESQEKKVISATGGNSLWEVDKDNPNFIKSQDDKGISANDKRIIDVGTPTFLTDATTKVYVDDLLDKKQNKLIAGENITIDENNKISATDSSGESLWEIDPNSPNIIQPKEKRLITANNTRMVYIADPTQPQNAVNLQTLDKKIKETESKFPIAFQINAVSKEIPNLETTNKTVVSAINENKKIMIELINEIKKIIINNGNWIKVAEVVHTINNNHTINYQLKLNTEYRLYFNYSNFEEIVGSGDYQILHFISKPENNLNDIEVIQSDITHDFTSNNNDYYRNIIFITKNRIINMLNSNTSIKIGNLWKLEELQKINNENIYKITSNTLNIISPNKINMNKPIKIISNNLETNEIE